MTSKFKIAVMTFEEPSLEVLDYNGDNSPEAIEQHLSKYYNLGDITYVCSESIILKGGLKNVN